MTVTGCDYTAVVDIRLHRAIPEQQREREKKKEREKEGKSAAAAPDLSDH